MFWHFQQLFINPIYHFGIGSLGRHHLRFGRIDGNKHTGSKRYGTIQLNHQRVIVGYQEADFVLHLVDIRFRQVFFWKYFCLLQEDKAGTYALVQFYPIIGVPFWDRTPVPGGVGIHIAPPIRRPVLGNGDIIAHDVIALVLEIPPHGAGNGWIDTCQPVLGPYLVRENHLHGKLVIGSLVQEIVTTCCQCQGARQ